MEKDDGKVMRLWDDFLPMSNFNESNHFLYLQSNLRNMAEHIEPLDSRNTKQLDCLLIQQPYASLIAFGRKRWEFRSYETKKRGIIGIAASPSSVLLTRNREINSISHLFPRGVLLATANIVNCFFVTGADLKKAITEAIKITVHGHDVCTLDAPIGEPLEDVTAATDSKSWESFVWELGDVKPFSEQIPIEKKSRSTWVKVELKGGLPPSFG